MEKVNLETDIINLSKYKRYYYKKSIFILDSTSDTWENNVRIIGNGNKEIIYGNTSADSPKDLQDKDFLDLLIKAKRHVDNKVINI